MLLDSCTELLARVWRFEHPADAVVARFLRERRCGPRERALLADAAYAALRRKRWFENLAATSSVGTPHRALAILGMQAAGHDFGRARAALSEKEHQWLAACMPMHPPQDAQNPLHHNLPDWLAQLLQQELHATGAEEAEFAALARSLARGAPLDLRVNTLRARRDALRRELADSGIESAHTPHSPWGLRVAGKPALARLAAWQRGALEVQDEGAQLLAVLTGARRDELVADFCAGAGGKTLALGAAMRNSGRVYALDVAAQRLAALTARVWRAGLDNVYPMAIAHEGDARLNALAGKMDRVLVDAPCSGLGTLRRQPDLAWRQSPAAVQALAQRQSAILRSAARLVKSGGWLVYATCSLLHMENEAVAQAFAAAQPQFAPQDAGELLARGRVAQAASLCQGGGSGTQYLRLWPQRHGCDGFFAAVWRRR